MQPLIPALIVCAALVVVYPPAALVIFVAAVAILGWASWRKARGRAVRPDRGERR